MNTFIKNSILLLSLLLLVACKTPQGYVFSSESLKIKKISKNAFVHISYLSTKSFGKVPCNGMVVIDNGEAIIVDTPTNDAAATDLLQWIKTSKNSTPKAVVITHFHVDCLGGLAAFHQHGIPSYANKKTITLAQLDEAIIPQNGFDDYLELSLGQKKLYNQFLGEGHTKDNIVCYFPSEKILFGGCLLKADGAGKGNLKDATINEWSNSVKKVKATYPDAKIVIPGHGKVGGLNLLDYTIELFDIK